MKQSRVSGMLKTLTALQPGQNNRVADLAKIRKLSRRTISRHLKELQAIGVPLRYDGKTGGYILEPEFFVPPLDLNLQEVLSLFLVVHKTPDQIQLPFENSALRAALKIANKLPAKIKRYCNKALRYISIRAIAQANVEHLDSVFGQLLIAILTKRVVTIRYHFPRERTTKLINLSPLHLMFNVHWWYVLGKSDLYKGITAFKLNRIKELNTSYKYFIREGNFNIREYLGRVWSMVREGKLYNIRLRFLPEVAHDVAEVQWHSTQTVTFKDDGSAIIEFCVDGLNEITWWILSYGDQVQVLAPKVLREKIVEIAQKIVSTSEQESFVIE